MVYRFTIISDESEDFVREIHIDPDKSFLELHQAIIKSVGYSDEEMCSFFICDDNWEKEIEITRHEMDDSSSEIDNWTMEETPLNKFVEDEKQKLLYIFDFLAERAFFIELSEIITGKNIKKTLCTRSEGSVPPQSILEEEQTPTVKKADKIELELDDAFYGDQEFDAEDFDVEDKMLDKE